MNWKTLGKAFLVVSGIAAIVFIIAILFRIAPWTMYVFVFIAAVFWVYDSMSKYDSSDNDEEEYDEEELEEDEK